MVRPVRKGPDIGKAKTLGNPGMATRTPGTQPRVIAGWTRRASGTMTTGTQLGHHSLPSDSRRSPAPTRPRDEISAPPRALGRRLSATLLTAATDRARHTSQVGSRSHRSTRRSSGRAPHGVEAAGPRGKPAQPRQEHGKRENLPRMDRNGTAMRQRLRQKSRSAKAGEIVLDSSLCREGDSLLLCTREDPGRVLSKLC